MHTRRFSHMAPLSALLLIAACAVALSDARVALPVDVASLSAIISDPIKQHESPSLVKDAMRILGDLGDAPAVDSLVGNVAFPRERKPLPAGTKHVLTVPEVGGLGRRVMPAVDALVTIGDGSIPAVLRKLTTTDNSVERGACLAVLIELREKGEVKALIQSEKQRMAGSPKALQRLDGALALVPLLHRQGEVSPGHEPDYWSDEDQKGFLRTDRRRVIALTEGKVPPLVVGKRRVLPAPASDRANVIAPAQALGRLVGLTVTPVNEAGEVRLSRGGQSAKSVTVSVGSLQGRGDAGPVPLPVAPKRADGDVLVPVHAVAEALGFTTTWEADLRILWIK